MYFENMANLFFISEQNINDLHILEYLDETEINLSKKVLLNLTADINTSISMLAYNIISFYVFRFNTVLLTTVLI